MIDEARLDGGDVLTVGDHIFIGLSTRTNEAGVAFFRQVCQPLGKSVHAIPVPAGLHLKSAVSLLDDTVLLAADDSNGRQIATAIAAAAALSVIYVPDTVCCNVLRIGSNLVVQAGFPQSEVILDQVATKLNLTGPLAFRFYFDDTPEI
jgi:dimethylargininase